MNNTLIRFLSGSCRKVVVTTGIFCLISITWGQTPVDPKTSIPDKGTPEPPFILPAPVPSSWTVTTTTIANSKEVPNEKKPSHVTSAVKNESLYREITTFDEGTTRTRWITEGLIMHYQSHWPKEYILSRAVETEVAEFEIPPLGPDTFKGTVTLNGVSCHYHESKESPNRISGEPGKDYVPPLMKIWIDVETRLPVKTIEEGEIVITSDYEFEKKAERLTLPPVFQKRLEAWKNIPKQS